MLYDPMFFFLKFVRKRSIEDICPQSGLQLNRRRSAGRGLERRPAPIAREARRPTRGTPEECADAVLVCIYSVLSAIE